MARSLASGDSFLRLCGVALIAALWLAPEARAQTGLGESAKELLGPWEFSTADRQTACTVTFKADRATGKGFRVEFEEKCAAVYSSVKDIASWTLPDNDLLNLLDASGRSLIEFSEVESGIFEAPVPGHGVLFLQRADAAGPPPPKADDLAGDWTIMRGGKALCGLTLTMTATEEELALTVKPGCDPAIARLNFTRWRVDRDELMLRPERGNPWRFEEDEGKVWSRVPETPNPYTLVRQ